MEQPTLVRDLHADESGSLARTGDVLPDGSVLLRLDDVDRMGLPALREWLLARMEEEARIAVLEERAPRWPAGALEELA